jgi:cell division initiation protein
MSNTDSGSAAGTIAISRSPFAPGHADGEHSPEAHTAHSAVGRENVAPAEPKRLPSPDRGSTVTPLDLRQAKFSTALRGFDRNEVTAFLLEVSDGYEQALRENERLRQDIGRLEASLRHYRELEGGLKSTMLTAQRFADGMRENARLEAERIVREAEGHAELLMNRAHARLEDVQREIDGLRLKRREAETNLESIISALHHTLEFVRDQDARERQERERATSHAATIPLGSLIDDIRPHADIA